MFYKSLVFLDAADLRPELLFLGVFVSVGLSILNLILGAPSCSMHVAAKAIVKAIANRQYIYGGVSLIQLDCSHTM